MLIEMESTVGLTLNYRNVDLTVTCVQSLLANGLDHVLIWDNSDDQRASLLALSEQLRGESRVSILCADANLGFAAGVNRGVDWIAGEFPRSRVLLINNDAVLLLGAAALLNAAANQNPEACIVYPAIDHGGKVLGTVYYHRLMGVLSTGYLPGAFRYASGCCQLILPDRHQGPVFDEDFFMYGEDWEQGWRLEKSAMHHVQSVLVTHIGSVSSGMASQFYESRLVLAHLLLAQKIAKNGVDRYVLFTLRVVILSLRALLRSFRYRSAVPLKALWFGVDHIGKRLNDRPI